MAEGISNIFEGAEIVKVELEDGKEIIIGGGNVAKQSDGSAIVQIGGSVILATACYGQQEVEETDFLPLTVNFIERFYASGKIPGGFVKREGKFSDKEILVSRLIDRAIRPLFPKHFNREIQIIVTAVSADQINPVDVISIIGSSTALSLSSLPFQGPIGAVRITLSKDRQQYIVNPTFTQIDESILDIVVAGTKEGIIMVEGGAKEVTEEELLKALDVAQRNIQKIIEAQEELAKRIGKPKMVFSIPELPEEVKQEIRNYQEKIKSAMNNPDKKAREQAMKEVEEEILKNIKEKFGDTVNSVLVKTAIEDLEQEVMRKQIIEEEIRVDGRKPDDIRPIKIQVGVLPRTHGSALFTRGQTQSLGITTLGSASDVQFIDDPEEEGIKRFMLHYYFPPYSTGEVKKLGTPSRREIGHGHLAERAIEAVLPSEEEFPYTIRVVSEILESNGSSSMATVCSASLSLIDAGVPIKSLVAGIAMGIIYESENRYAILTDIQGIEDRFGNMDFKIAGTRNGITAFQMDVKLTGLPKKVLQEALYKAKKAREYILDLMEEAIKDRELKLSEYAPRIKTLKVDQDKIPEIIGPGGKVIKRIIQETGVKVFISEDGKVTISAKPGEGDIEKAYKIIQAIAKGINVGDVFEGVVTRIEDYGVFVEILPGKEGLVHISNLFKTKIKGKLRDYIEPGIKLQVKVIGIDHLGRINLSHKDVE